MIYLIGSISILVALLLIIVVLIQNPKGGGLDSGFGSATQLGGVRKTTDFLEKATWTLAIVLFVLSLAATPLLNNSSTSTEDVKTIINTEDLGE